MAVKDPQGPPPAGKNDIDWLMQQPGVSGVLEGTQPLHIITEKQLPPQTRQAIADRFGAGNVEFHPDGPIKAQGTGAGRAAAAPPSPASAPAAGGRVSRLRQFKQDPAEE